MSLIDMAIKIGYTYRVAQNFVLLCTSVQMRDSLGVADTALGHGSELRACNLFYLVFISSPRLLQLLHS